MSIYSTVSCLISQWQKKWNELLHCGPAFFYRSSFICLFALQWLSPCAGYRGHRGISQCFICDIVSAVWKFTVLDRRWGRRSDLQTKHNKCDEQHNRRVYRELLHHPCLYSVFPCLFPYSVWKLSPSIVEVSGGSSSPHPHTHYRVSLLTGGKPCGDT